MTSTKALKITTLAALTLLLIGLAGCSRKIVVHPITDKDIFVEEDKICFSKWYFEEVMKAKLNIK